MTARRYAVELTQGAEDDLEAIHTWIAEHRSADDADALLDRFIETVDTLERFPLRGSVPQELESLGIREFRQLLLAPYRLIYRATADTGYILVIADGRRDMQTLLERRLLQR